ncbi:MULTISPECIES: hypothetical protein [Fructobacillus]|uniref:Phage protein n=1 Tax=Fructobacillus cardui TaxID=2893170 RepID=A0ABM9MRY4_9LACO|nr:MULTISPECIES: hypothetical protein [Fructobacillus]MCK8627159.1 hypothetical protein [Fructobacillus cardui]GIC69554.1 hypothetical protein FT12353_01910 [Fructobacillus tropaeoli]CAK1235758.1 unnamed protein product [Fructobacillus cardui]
MQNWGIDEWASLVGIIASSITALSYGLKYVVIKPLTSSMERLNESFAGLNSTLKLMQSDVDRIDERVDDHETRITVLEKTSHQED